jgi:hypothetical protein
VLDVQSLPADLEGSKYPSPGQANVSKMAESVLMLETSKTPKSPSSSVT